MRRSELSQLVTGRPASMFNEDLQRASADLNEALADREVLVVGAAGTIGAATVRAMAEYPIRRLVLCDINENALVELLRDLRSSPRPPRVQTIRIAPIDASSGAMEFLLRNEQHLDYVLNFAASKHVRAERDVPSLLHMLWTNVLLQARLMRWLAPRATRVFAVSTDKAANPVSLMGTSKRLMEHVLFTMLPPGGICTATTARFANVAFSAGSLLEGWLHRIEKQQAIAVPADVRRYFVSEEEAGQLCLLAAILCPAGHVVVPALDPSSDLQLLTDVAGQVLAAHGLRPLYVPDEDAARSTTPTDAEWPVLVTPPDTAGEKPYEEFVGAGEQVADTRFATLRAIPAQRPAPELVVDAVERIERWCAAPPATLTKAEIARWLAEVVPELRHADSALTLDERM